MKSFGTYHTGKLVHGVVKKNKFKVDISNDNKELYVFAPICKNTKDDREGGFIFNELLKKEFEKDLLEVFSVFKDYVNRAYKENLTIDVKKEIFQKKYLTNSFLRLDVAGNLNEKGKRLLIKSNESNLVLDFEFEHKLDRDSESHCFLNIKSNMFSFKYPNRSSKNLNYTSSFEINICGSYYLEAFLKLFSEEKHSEFILDNIKGDILFDE